MAFAPLLARMKRVSATARSAFELSPDRMRATAGAETPIGGRMTSGPSTETIRVPDGTLAHARSVPRGEPSLQAGEPLGTGSAHAKVILLGEHSVVYGFGAIALPVAGLPIRAELRRVHLSGVRAAARVDCGLYSGPIDAAPDMLSSTLTAFRASCEAYGVEGGGVSLRIDSHIPAGRGLGSSAASAAAVVTAVAAAAGIETQDDATRHELIQAAERISHGTPSGLDARSVVADGPIWFREGVADRLNSSPLWLVVADTGVPSSTHTAVAAVRERRAATPHRIDAIMARLGELAQGAVTELAQRDHSAVGARMDEAHALLSSLGVSSEGLDGLVSAAKAAGAWGAKLTGSGGGGCVIALAGSRGAAIDLAAKLRRAGARQTWLTGAGVA